MPFRRLSLAKLLAVVVILILVAELVARFALGFGTPPLSIADPHTEYRFQQNQDVMRYHNRLFYNEYSMRSPPLSEVTAARRVLVLGDSVLNGGNRTDHGELATTLASDDTRFFGNASAGSWGPANLLGWVERYGFIGADTVVLVLNSEDLHDLPSFEPLDRATRPTEAPLSALTDMIFSEVLPRLSFESAPPKVRDESSLQTGMQQIENLIDRVAENGLRLCLVQHWQTEELADGPYPTSGQITEIFAGRNVPTLSTAPAYTNGGGDRLFRDTMHLNAEGQQVLAPLLRQCDDLAQVPSGTGE